MSNCVIRLHKDATAMIGELGPKVPHPGGRTGERKLLAGNQIRAQRGQLLAGLLELALGV